MNVTPKGKLTGFVAIEKPSTKFDENGTYSCQVEFTGNDAKKMKQEINALMAESMAENKSVKRAAQPPYTENGADLVVRFKGKARITSRSGDVWEKKVQIFDAANKPVEGTLNIGEGSTVRVAWSPYKWGVAALGCGCTLQPEMVQVINLVTYANSAASPFDAEEGFTEDQAHAKEDKKYYDF